MAVSLSENRDRRVPDRRRVLYALVLVGGLLRLIELGAKCLWVDEIDSVFVSERIGRLIEYCRGGHTPPLRYLIVWALQKAPNPEFAIRLPAAVFGTLSIPLVLWIGERLWDWRAGVAASVLLLLSPWHLLHSQDARYYAVILFLALVALALSLRIVQEPGPLWRWIVLAVVGAVNIYISYIALFSVLSVGGYLVWCLIVRAWRSRRDRGERDSAKTFLRGMAVAGLVGFLALAPWLPVLLGVFGRYAGETPDAPAAEVAEGAPDRPPVKTEVLWRTRYDWAYANDYLRKLGLEQPVVKWSLLIFFAIGFVQTVRRDRSFGVLAALWIGLPWVVIFSTSIRYFAPPRYLIHYLGLYVLLCGVGMMVVWDTWLRLLAATSARGGSARVRRGCAYGAAAAVVLAGVLAYAREDIRYFRTEKQDWRSVVRFLEQNVRPSEAVLAGASWTDRGLRYYGAELDTPMHLVRNCFTAPRIVSQLAIHRRLWFVTWGPIPRDVCGVLDSFFEPVRIFPSLQGDILIFRSKTTGGDRGG